MAVDATVHESAISPLRCCAVSLAGSHALTYCVTTDAGETVTRRCPELLSIVPDA